MTFEPGPYVYRGTPFTATATVTGPGGLSQSLPVTYTGNCTTPTTTNGCSASASYAGTAVYLPSTATQSITILQPTDPQPVTGFKVDSVNGGLVRFRWTAPLFGPAPQGYVLEGGTEQHDGAGLDRHQQHVAGIRSGRPDRRLGCLDANAGQRLDERRSTRYR